MNNERILSETRTSIEHLRKIDSFLEYLDSLDGSELQGWDYLREKIFSDERDALFELINVLETELLPEAEERASGTT